MSALAQPHRSHAQPAEPVPALRVVPRRPKGIFDGKTRAEVRDMLHRSQWNPLDIVPDLGRVSSGTCQMSIILVLHLYSKGGRKKKEERSGPEWTPVFRPEDFAKATFFSAQACRREVADLVERGILIRKGDRYAGDGGDCHRYKIDYAAMRDAKKAFKDRWEPERTRGGAFVSRKPAASERGEYLGEPKAKVELLSMACEESPTIAMASPVLLLAAGEVAVAAELTQPGKVEVTHSLPCAVAVESTVTQRGGVRIHLSCPDTISPGSMGELQSGSPPPPAPPSQPAGAGLFDLSAALADLGFACDDKMLADLRRSMPRDSGFEEFFVQRLTKRVERAFNRSRPLDFGLLPRVLGDAVEAWRNGGQKLWENRRAKEAEQDGRQAAGQLARDRSLAGRILESADKEWSDGDRVWARGVLKGAQP